MNTHTAFLESLNNLITKTRVTRYYATPSAQLLTKKTPRNHDTEMDIEVSESQTSGKLPTQSPDRGPTPQNGGNFIDTHIDELSWPSTNIDPASASGSPERKMNVDEAPWSRPRAVRSADSDTLHASTGPSYDAQDSLGKTKDLPMPSSLIPTELT